MGNKKNWKWETDQRKRFINPYNFVSLGEKKSSGSQKKEETYTGSIQCTMVTKTPVFVPNSSCEDAFDIKSQINDHKNYDFFSYHNLEKGEANNHYQLPVIPGSEIRGMLRSVYEVLSNSCLSSIGNELLTGRITMPKNPGIVECKDGIFTLYKANKNKLQTYKNKKGEAGYSFNIQKGTVIGDNGKQYKNNQKVRFDMGEKAVDYLGDGGKEGILYIGEASEGKVYDGIFTRKGKVESAKSEQIKEAIQKMKELMEIYRNESINLNLKEKTHFGYPSVHIPDPLELEERKETVSFAVWYEIEGDRLYFSPACISRTAYYTTLSQFYKGYEPCENIHNLCKACQLFGTVQKKAAHSSNIRVSDAALYPLPDGVEKEEYLKKEVYYPTPNGFVTLQALASPKASAKEFYLKRPNSCLTWNYDFKTIGYKGMNKEVRRLTSKEQRIRGRKFYWHNPAMKFPEQQPSELNVSVRPVQKNQKFKFEIYFEQITKAQIEELIWTITLGENDPKGRHCHKIGMGKPLGMGSVKIVIDRLLFRTLEIKNGTIEYKIKASDAEDYDLDIVPEIENPFENEDSSYYKELMIITDFHALDGYIQKDPNIVSYPLGYNGKAEAANREASHQWFHGNRFMGSRNEMQENIQYTLPEILDLNDSEKDISLPKLNMKRQK